MEDNQEINQISEPVDSHHSSEVVEGKDLLSEVQEDSYQSREILEDRNSVPTRNIFIIPDLTISKLNKDLVTEQEENYEEDFSDFAVDDEMLSPLEMYFHQRLEVEDAEYDEMPDEERKKIKKKTNISIICTYLSLLRQKVILHFNFRIFRDRSGICSKSSETEVVMTLEPE